MKNEYYIMLCIDIIMFKKEFCHMSLVYVERLDGDISACWV